MEETELLWAALESLRGQVSALSDERELRGLLARYGFFADHGFVDEWLALFTEDAVFEHSVYIGTDLSVIDPLLFQPARLVGRDQLRTLLLSGAHQSIQGHSQHHMDGMPAIFKIDGDEATCYSYAAVYAAFDDNPSAARSYQSHFVNRWEFRRVERSWRISSCWRRRMGAGDAAQFLSGSGM